MYLLADLTCAMALVGAICADMEIAKYLIFPLFAWIIFMLLFLFINIAGKLCESKDNKPDD